MRSLSVRECRVNETSERVNILRERMRFVLDCVSLAAAIGDDDGARRYVAEYDDTASAYLRAAKALSAADLDLRLERKGVLTPLA